MTTNNNKNQTDEASTYNIVLDVRAMGEYAGNCGPKFEYGYCYTPCVLSLKKGNKKIMITLSGSTDDCFLIKGIKNVSAGEPKIPARSVSFPVKYEEGHYSTTFIINMIDTSKGGLGFICDPQVQNSPPP